MQNNRITDIIALKKIMIDNQINTITELSDLTKINRNTLSKILKGKIQPSARDMYKIVEILQINPEQAGKIFFSYSLT